MSALRPNILLTEDIDSQWAMTSCMPGFSEPMVCENVQEMSSSKSEEYVDKNTYLWGIRNEQPI